MRSVKEKSLPSGTGIAHDSFHNTKSLLSMSAEEFKSLDASLVISFTREELVAANETLPFIRQYSRLKDELRIKGKLSPIDAQKLTNIESTALFLMDPFAILVAPRTNLHFRTFRFLELIGVLDENSLKGNVILIGSGTTCPEVEGLNAIIEIPDIDAFESEAGILIEKLKEQKPDPKNFEKFKYEFDPYTYPIRNTILLGRRLKNDQMIIALEPFKLLKDAAISEHKESLSPFKHSRLNILPDTLGEYLSFRNPVLFSFIASIRTDPNIWTSKLKQAPDFTSAQNTLNYKDPIIYAAAQYRGLKESLANFSQIFKSLLTLTGSQTQILITFGLGNNESELSQRHRLINFMDIFFKYYKFNVFKRSIIEFFENGVWTKSPHMDYGLITANPSQQTYSMLETNPRSDVIYSQRKKRKRQRK